MINIIIFSCFCLTAALFLIGFMCYKVIKMSKSLNQSVSKLRSEIGKTHLKFEQLNINFMQNNMMMQLVGKQVSEFEAKFQEQLHAVKSIPVAAPVPLTTPIETPSSPIFLSKETIEQNYERAKSLLKRGMPLDRELMKSCQMTEEEFELLAETMGTD
jgi:hypothetical protein